MNAAAALGLGDNLRLELARALLADDVRHPGKIRKFLVKVGDGAFAGGPGVRADVAATQLNGLISAYPG